MCGGLGQRTRSIRARCVVCATRVPRARSLLCRSQRIQGAVRTAFQAFSPTRPLLISTATQGAHWTECTARAPRTPRASRAPLPRTFGRTRPASRIACNALPRHRWSPPLAPLACAVKRQHELDGQSYGARAGGASTCWVSPVASKDAQAVSRGATTIRAIWQRRRHVGQRICSLYVFEVCVGMAPLDNLRSKFSESYRVR